MVDPRLLGSHCCCFFGLRRGITGQKLQVRIVSRRAVISISVPEQKEYSNSSFVKCKCLVCKILFVVQLVVTYNNLLYHTDYCSEKEII